MSFRLDIITTNDTGAILTTTPNISGIGDGFTLEQNAGDERHIKSGDLLLSHNAVFSYSWTLQVRHVWMAVYYNGSLYDVFELSSSDYPSDEEYDLGNNHFRTRLRSLNALFYDALKQTTLQYSAVSSDWNYSLSQGIVSIDEVRILNSTGAQLTKLDVYGFSLADTLTSLAGRHNDQGYEIRSVINSVIPIIAQDTLPILFRGDGYSIGITSLEDAINHTFYANDETGELFNLSWAELFKLAVFGWNAFLKVVPVIESGVLKIDLEILPKTKVTTAGAISKTWSSLMRHQKRYQLDGVVLEGSNFTFVKRAAAGNVAKYQLPIANPDAIIDPNKKELYWVAGDAVGSLNGGYERYNILDGSSQNRPYAEESIIDPYYTEFFENGTTYEGKLIFNGEQLFDKYTVPWYGAPETIQVNKVVVNRGMADIEGVVINP